MNIHNAAVLVINNETMAVEAYVGSADFHNPFDGGQVDGVRAVRSPGSTLKPLLYATAFDAGIITPKQF
jgi:penicillin-binding protein 1C